MIDGQTDKLFDQPSVCDTTISNFRSNLVQKGRWFVLSAGVILLLTGLAKIVDAFGHSRVLEIADPVFGVSFRYLLLGVGALELGISAICFFNDRRLQSTFLIMWLATGFAAYRSALWWIHWEKPCNCLGSLTDALHISPQTADHIAQVLLAYLFIGGFSLLCSSLKTKRTQSLLSAAVRKNTQ